MTTIEHKPSPASQATTSNANRHIQFSHLFAWILGHLHVWIGFALFVCLLLGMLYYVKETKINLVNDDFLVKITSFDMPPVVGSLPTINDNTFVGDGKFSVFNIFASWCVACKAEHSFLIVLAKNEDIQMVGLAYKDTQDKAEKFLQNLGNPFSVIALDESGVSGVNIGITGVPETIIIGSDGQSLHHIVGALDEEKVEEILLMKEKYTAS